MQLGYWASVVTCVVTKAIASVASSKIPLRSPCGGTDFKLVHIHGLRGFMLVAI
jgi:hypothetical protein